jgi:hypothetical protein
VDVGPGNTTYRLGAAPADYDGDGDLDLLIYQSADWSEGKPKGSVSLESSLEDDNGNPNLLYENTDKDFERVTDAVIEGERWSLAASFTDLTGNGRPDIHVANDYNKGLCSPAGCREFHSCAERMVVMALTDRHPVFSTASANYPRLRISQSREFSKSSGRLYAGPNQMPAQRTGTTAIFGELVSGQTTGCICNALGISTEPGSVEILLFRHIIG